jgi:predicted dehydrogenase
LIGKVTHVEVGLPGGHVDFKNTKDKLVATLSPPELDYNRWVGPSDWLPYVEGRVHMNWRWNYNFGGGQLLDWIGHHCDIAHWGLGFDNSGPTEIDGKGEFPAKTAVWNTATKYRCNLTYPTGVTMTIAGGHSDIRGGTKWIGTDGWVWVDRGGFDGSNPEWKEWTDLPVDVRKVKLIRSRNHYRNFLDSVKSREPTITPADTAHHSAIPGHLGLISMLVGRKIYWNPNKQNIMADEEATKLLSRRYREPWKLG